MTHCITLAKDRRERKSLIKRNLYVLRLTQLCNILLLFYYCQAEYLYNFILLKGKTVHLKVWSGPEGSRKLRFPDFVTTTQDGGKFVRPTHRPFLPPGNAPRTHFC